MVNTKFGFSLIELLISLTIGTLIVAGLMNVVIHSKLTTTEQGLEAQVTNQLDLAEYYFKQALHSAGYIGYYSLSPSSIDNTKLTNKQINNQGSVQLVMIQGLAPDQQGNDQIRIGSADPQIYYTGDFVNKGDKTISIQGSISGSLEKKLMIISGLNGAESLVVTRVEPNSTISVISFSDPTSLNYPLTAEVFVWHDRTYLIKAASFKEENNQLCYALYQQEPNKQSQELAFYISGLHIQYSTDGGEFYLYDSVSDWQKIKIVQISLTASAHLGGKKLTQTRTFYVTLRNRRFY